MQNKEIGDLQGAQSKKRNVIVGVGIAALVALALMGWMMTGSDRGEYTVGSPCSGDCGVYQYDAWICLKEQKYCTRPCGKTHPKCPDGFTCQQVDGAPATVVKDMEEQRSTYCLK